MKTPVLLAALLLLAACATAPADAPAPAAAAPTATSTDQAAARVAQMLSAAGAAGAPTQTDVERMLGRADIARQDGAGVALTYRYDTCALLLLFAADADNAMRLTEAHPGPRRTGEAAPSVQQCAAEAAARRA